LKGKKTGSDCTSRWISRGTKGFKKRRPQVVEKKKSLGRPPEVGGTGAPTAVGAHVVLTVSTCGKRGVLRGAPHKLGKKSLVKKRRKTGCQKKVFTPKTEVRVAQKKERIIREPKPRFPQI